MRICNHNAIPRIFNSMRMTARRKLKKSLRKNTETNKNHQQNLQNLKGKKSKNLNQINSTSRTYHNDHFEDRIELLDQ